MTASPAKNHRILIVDDNQAIHGDFRKILLQSSTALHDLAAEEAALFGDAASSSRLPEFEIDSAYQGEEALALIEKRLREGKPYAMAFMDVRMPPGWDGVETTARIWERYPDLQVVICTAYSDYSWEEMLQKLGYSDRLVILKKPFDNVEVVQLAIAMTEKWGLSQQAKLRLADLEEGVRERTRDLEAANASLAQEMKARLQMEAELRQAQKLESVGRLAAGVAHEINTPIQFVSDSVHFLRDATSDLIAEVVRMRKLHPGAANGASSVDLVKVDGVELEPHLAYAVEDAPKAFANALDGLDRVSNIVRSMKEFAHPDSTEMVTIDLNRTIESTLVIARGEYKYVAEVETILGDLPPIKCYAGEFNQVILNILVNAAHAIEDVVKDSERKGRILVRTWLEEADVLISIADTGSGIPDDIREKVFDPFFTTKEIGRGTGQGLAIARSVIVDKHKGRLYLESVMGQGTTFFIRLPVAGPKA